MSDNRTMKQSSANTAHNGSALLEKYQPVNLEISMDIVIKVNYTLQYSNSGLPNEFTQGREPHMRSQN